MNTLDFSKEDGDKILLAYLQETLLTESEFSHAINEVTDKLIAERINWQIIVEADGQSIATYGNEPGRTDWEWSDSFEIGPLKCRWSACPRATGGNAKMQWELFQTQIKPVLREHWNLREAVTGVWTAQEAAIQRKRNHRVENDLAKSGHVAFIRMDCDGFGAAKAKMGGGDVLANQLAQNVTGFIRNKMSSEFLVFHPHGDEFEIISLGVPPRRLARMLACFQDQFAEKDFRPQSYATPVKLGIRMAVAAWAGGGSEGCLDLATLVSQSGYIDIKKRKDRNFIEFYDTFSSTEQSLQRANLEIAALLSRSNLHVARCTLFANELFAYFVDALTTCEPSMTLQDVVTKEAKRFAFKVYAGDRWPPRDSTDGRSISRWVHTAELACGLLHALLKRRLHSQGPLAPDDTLRVTTRRKNDYWDLAIQRQRGTDWVDVLNYPGVAASSSLTANAGLAWNIIGPPSGQQIESLTDNPPDTVSVDNSPLSVDAGVAWNELPPLDYYAKAGANTENVVYRWLPAVAEPVTLQNALLVLVGQKAQDLANVAREWVAELVALDHRPVASGNLPDFWQSNVARIISICLRNPNIRDIFIVVGDNTTVPKTLDILNGGCIPEPNGAGAHEPWSQDRISEIASGTTIRETLLRQFLERHVRIQRVIPELDKLSQALLDSLCASPKHLSCSGESCQIEWHTVRPQSATKAARDFSGNSLGDVYPEVIRAMRDASTQTYIDHDGSTMSELTAVRIELTSALDFPVPHYWRDQSMEFESYYRRAFTGPESLFGQRLYCWGADAGNDRSNSVDQRSNAIREVIAAIKSDRVTRRIILSTPQSNGTSIDPLGLTCIYVYPRRRDEGGNRVWYIDLIWVWRSVEAIVGLPFSVYGSVSFSQELTLAIAGQLDGASGDIKLGRVTYLAMSLHMFCHPADLGIARAIDLEARA